MSRRKDKHLHVNGARVCGLRTRDTVPLRAGLAALISPEAQRIRCPNCIQIMQRWTQAAYQVVVITEKADAGP